MTLEPKLRMYFVLAKSGVSMSGPQVGCMPTFLDDSHTEVWLRTVAEPSVLHEAADGAAGAVAPVLQHDGVGVFLQRRIDLLRDLGQRLVPGDALPLALTAGADPLQRIEDAVGVVGVPHARIALGAKPSARRDVLRVALELDDAAVLHVGDGAVLDVADVAGEGDRLALALGDRAEVLARPVSMALSALVPLLLPL